MKDNKSTAEVIMEERKQLENDGIPYTYEHRASKWFCIIRTDKGEIRYCPYRRNAWFNKKSYNVKRLKNFLNKNNMEILK